ncbi:malonyl-CoA synthase [Ancylobacter sonchi]|uniref:malonate--CoA ligase n=1 Tax=Ancylobacter sonchi TaxID=1937790 RepID=UPI001BD5AB18|nr:malonyl-CoA synthase [Ancylobacter sonchi]MBS7533979.1 malonyl-CoA synthase [Ancylobacter sonchi]
MSSNANLYAAIEASARRVGDAIAFWQPDGSTLSYAELLALVGRHADALTLLGVGRGDRVTVQVEKSLGNVALYLATLKIGAVYQPLNTAYTAAELDYFLGDAEPVLLVADPRKAETLRPIAAARGVRHVETLGADGEGSLADLAATLPGTVETALCAPDDLAALLYTSGTTGRSKGAMITHRNLSSNAQALLEIWAFQPGDVLLHALPIFHVHGLFVALNTALLNGSEIIWLPRFDTDMVIAQLPRATVMMGVPTFYTRLLAHAGFTRELVKGMRLFIAGSAPLLAETHRQFETATGHAILERYGMTECGMITSNPYDGARLPGSVGYALPDVSVRIVGEKGAELPRGEVGMLETNGPNRFLGYWRMPEKTAAEIRPDGFFITGDLASMAPDGRVTIVGRGKDLIISGGLNIYPKEIEMEIDQFPGVVESAVIGVPHADFGEAVVAVVVARAAASLDDKALGAWLGDRLARFKLPKHIATVEELPRNTMGKVQKAALRERYKGLFPAG